MEHRRFLKESPEFSPVSCPYCGSDARFIGFQPLGVVFQPFDPPKAEGESADYEASDHYDLLGYRYVRCSSCANLVWYDADFYLDSATLDALRALASGTPHELLIEEFIVDRSLEGLLREWPVFPVNETIDG